jgi:formyltetrahydrofolate deformylase
MSNNKKCILLISCEDAPKIIASITTIIANNNGNIKKLEQYTNKETNKFSLRVTWVANTNKINFWENQFIDVFQKFSITYKFYNEEHKENLAILVSKASHCLYDILSHHQSNRLNTNIAFVASNHQDLQHIVEQLGYKFIHCPIVNGDKKNQEATLLSLMQQHNVSLIALARYMQILSSDFINHYQNKIINIHHSLLPAFIGARPYKQAWEKGVKMIGATSHFVTSELDQGPIICQSIKNICYEDSINDLVEAGKTIEQQNLINALKLYLSHKILVDNNKTVIFK